MFKKLSRNKLAKSKPKPKKKRSWIEVGGPVRSEPEQGVYSATYSLAELSKRKIIKPDKFIAFQQKTHLNDLYWRSYWTRGDIVSAGGRREFSSKTSAVVVFMHGWDGSHSIWENLPARLCQQERNLLILSADVNGFGQSTFQDPDRLELVNCAPKAAMRAVEQWLQLLGILGGRRHVPIVFVGHSMSGAALFYLNAQKWSQHTIGRCAVAPALLMNDLLRKGFYQSLGVGIRAGSNLMLEKLTEALSPALIQQLIFGASKAVQAEHERIFKSTHKHTLAHTFFAMGQAPQPPSSSSWKNFKVLLGHSDRLVGVGPMLNLLAGFGFPSRNIRVILGDHYFFSVGYHSKKQHQEGREITFEEIQTLVAQCRR
jgi:pimeloyl-ACP methyl ester carboxylesterase